MRIDYELAEKIGATHYCDKTYRLYKVSAMTLLVYIDDDWRLCLAGSATLFYIKPIPSKPPVRVYYEKVKESIFDLKDEFERGELYYSVLSEGREFVKITPNTSMSESYLVGNFQSNNLYRRIEKPVDWRDEVVKYLRSRDYYMSKIPDTKVLEEPIEINQNFIGDEFLEMCRVALRANGEL